MQRALAAGRAWRIAGDSRQNLGLVARPEGAMLAVRDDGLVVGSVSGGCIEDDIIDRVRREASIRASKRSSTASAPRKRTASACPAAARSSW
jgi:xanthine/CO dehydrogenase XdhC/CoxF family maturation factor